MLTPFGDALRIGAIQGLTEFLPVSSSGHVALARILFHSADLSPRTTAMLHVGMLAATLLVMRHQIVEAFADALAVFRDPAGLPAPPPSDALFVVAAIGPSVAVAILLNDAASGFAASPLAVALGFFVTGAFLAATRSLALGTKDHPSFVQALLVGAAQGLAVLPGISRSAFTIGLALLFGVRPARAFELSLLLSIPVELGLVLLYAGRGSGRAEILVMIATAVAAFVTAIFGIRVLRRSVVRGFFPLFTFWVVPLGFATMALAWAWPAALSMHRLSTAP